MKVQHIVAIAFVTSLVTTALLVPYLAQGSEPTVQTVTVYQKEPHLSPAQILWLARLMQCESGLKSGAINPKDNDGTPSYGVLQFKPSTFKDYSNKYGITGGLMDATAQVAIVEQWLLRGVDVKGQFPGCVRKIGVPPSMDN